LNVKELDRIEWSHNMFLEYHGGSKYDEVIIVPLEFTFNIFAGLRQGIGSKYGPN